MIALAESVKVLCENQSIVYSQLTKICSRLVAENAAEPC